MSEKVFLSLIVMAALVSFSPLCFAQTGPVGQQRIPQPIIVNGQQVQGVLVIENGAVQSYTCQSPQPYVTTNQTESGWACLEQATGMWLLHAQPPQQATYVYQQPPVYVVTPPVPIYRYYPFSYTYYCPYSYYPYRYPYRYYPYRRTVGARFGVSFAYHSYRSPVVIRRPTVVRGPSVIRRPTVSRRPTVTRRPTIVRGPTVVRRSAAPAVRSGSAHSFGHTRVGGGFGRVGRR